LKILNIEMNGSKKTHCWTFLVTRSSALCRGIDASPHTSYLPNF
jgi:hypothetical protein